MLAGGCTPTYSPMACKNSMERLSLDGPPLFRIGIDGIFPSNIGSKSLAGAAGGYGICEGRPRPRPRPA